MPSLLKELRGEGASGVDVPDLQHRAQQLAEAWASGVGEPVAPSASFSQAKILITTLPWPRPMT